MIRHLLVAYDGSELGREAVRFAFRLAGPCAADVSVAHVVDGARPEKDGRLARPAELERAVARAPAGATCTAVVREGRPGPEIAALADELGADLVVAGTHGVGSLRRLVIGGTSQYLVENAGPPLALISGPLEPGGVPNVLVAVLSEHGEDELRLAQRLAVSLFAPLVLVHVVDSRVPFSVHPPAAMITTLTAAGRCVIKQARASMSAPLECVREDVRYAEPRTGLLEACREFAPAILVVADRGGSWLARLQLASPSLWLASHRRGAVVLPGRRRSWSRSAVAA